MCIRVRTAADVLLARLEELLGEEVLGVFGQLDFRLLLVQCCYDLEKHRAELTCLDELNEFLHFLRLESCLQILRISLARAHKFLCLSEFLRK